MRYFEENDGAYILSYGIGGYDGHDITEERYNLILSAVDSMPEDTEIVSYRLKVDLTYEPVAVEAVEDDIDEAEAYNIIFGGASE